jgi:hypothetical protein
MDCLYILELQGSRFFIGRSTNVEASIQEHEEGKGSTWVKKYLPIVDYTIHEYNDSYDVDKCVMLYAVLWGWNQVRGGSYEEELTEEQIKGIEKEREISVKMGRIRDRCNRCGSYDHYTEECYFGIDVRLKRREPVEDLESEECLPSEAHLSQEDKYKYTITCTRCGRQSHIVSKCNQTNYEDGTCIRCGLKGHGSDTCIAIVNKNGDCSECGREGHDSEECIAVQHIKGYNLDNSSGCILL